MHVSRHQWTPELAEDIARAQSVLFVDSSVAAPPGSIQLVPVAPAAGQPALATHHLGAPELLALANELYAALPRAALLLTVGAATTTLGEEFSQPVKTPFPQPVLSSKPPSATSLPAVSRVPPSAAVMRQLEHVGILPRQMIRQGHFKIVALRLPWQNSLFAPEE